VIQELERWAVFYLPQYEEVIEFAEYATPPSLLPYLLYPMLDVLLGEKSEIQAELHQLTETKDAFPESAEKKPPPPNCFQPFQEVFTATGVRGLLAAYNSIMEKRENYVAHLIARHVKAEEEKQHSLPEAIQALLELFEPQEAGEPSERGGGVTVEPSFGEVVSLIRKGEAVFVVYGWVHNFNANLRL